jgi:hypothetical protein
VSLPGASAARAIPPLAAGTFSPYRIGIRFDFHHPASITHAKSMFKANKSCVAHPHRMPTPEL